MQVHVPTVVGSSTLHLAKVDSAPLGRGPLFTPAEPSERLVQPVDVLLESVVGLAESERDQSEFSAFCEGGDGVGNVSGSVACTWRAESIAAFVAGQSVVVGVVCRLQNPCMLATM